MPDQNQIEYGYDDPNIHEPEVPVEGLVGSDKIVQDGIDSPHTPAFTLTPTPEQPYPSVQSPAGLFVWDPDLNSLRNISVEAPNAVKLPWGLEVYRDHELKGEFLVSSLDVLRDIIRALTLLYLGYPYRDTAFQYLCTYNTGATVAVVDPSLDDPINGTFKVWPSDWNGMMNAELQIKGGLGYNL